MLGYVSLRMQEPSLDDLKRLGLSVIGSDLDGKPSKQEERLAQEMVIKNAEIARLKDRLQRQKKKKRK